MVLRIVYSKFVIFMRLIGQVNSDFILSKQKDQNIALSLIKEDNRPIGFICTVWKYAK